jgi:hypothetical protein
MAQAICWLLFCLLLVPASDKPATLADYMRLQLLSCEPLLIDFIR